MSDIKHQDSWTYRLRDFFQSIDVADPVSDEFTPRKFLEQLEKFISPLELQKSNADDQEVVAAIIQLNGIYRLLKREIEGLVNETKQPKAELIREVLKISNFDSFSLTEMTFDEAKIPEKNHPRSITESKNLELKNAFGQKGDIQSAADTTIETCNELIKIISALPNQNTDLSKTPDTNRIIGLVRAAMIRANLLFNIKQAFASTKYEFSSIIRKEGIIKFKHTPEIYFLLKRAGRERFDSHVYEHLFYTSALTEATSKVSKLSVSNGIIRFEPTNERTRNMNKMFSVALQTSYFFYLFDLKIKQVEGLSVRDIFILVDEMKFLFQSIDYTQVTDEAVATTSLGCVPYYVGKERLINHLSVLASLKKNAVAKFLTFLSSEVNDQIDLWKKPLITQGRFYFFQALNLSHLNEAFIVDRFVQEFIRFEKHHQRFSEFVVNYVMDNDNKALNFSQYRGPVENQFPEALSEALIYELDTLFVIVTPCVIPYALAAIDYHRSLIEVGKATDKLNNQKRLFEAFLNENENSKQVVPVVCTNYPFLSGIVMQECFVLDHFLLKNYFSTGEYKRGMVVMGEGKMQPKEVAAYRYYEDSESMSRNFINFCISPDPIRNIVSSYLIKEFPIVLPGTHPQILEDGIEVAPMTHTIWNYVRELEYFFKQLFYFEKAFKHPDLNNDRAFIEKRIDYILPQILSAIAFQNDDRYARLEVLELFKKVGQSGLVYLINAFTNALLRLEVKHFVEQVAEPTVEIDHKKAQKHLKEILTASNDNQEKISLTLFKLSHSLSPEDLKNVINHLISVLTVFRQRPYSEEQLEDFYALIIVFTALTAEEKAYEKYLYHIYLNFIDALNFNFQYQKARDLAEEILQYSFSNQRLPLLGWICLFKCFLKQKNIYDAAFYGALFVTCVEILPEVDEELFTHTIYNSMLFFRDFHFVDMETALFETLQRLRLSEYDKQKITLSHFYAQLFDSPLENLDAKLPDVQKYLQDNLASICEYGETGALPWLSLLYNFRLFHQRGILKSDLHFFEEAISILEKEIESKTLASLQAQIFPIETVSKKLLEDIIVKLFETRDFNDFAFELENIEPLAKNVLSLSLEPIDLKALFQTGLIINDQSLTFPSSPTSEGFVNFTKKSGKDIEQKVRNYDRYILDKVQTKSGQLIVWLFNLSTSVYVLHITDKKDCNLISVPEWSMPGMRQWMGNIGKFHFDDKGDYPINMQEAEYLKVCNELAFSSLEFGSDIKEILYYSSIDLSQFPHNLLMRKNVIEDENDGFHEYAVQNYIAREHTDFISVNLPVTNIISLEWFIENGSPLVLKPEEITIETWIPLMDDDIALNIGYSKMKPIIEDKYGFVINTELVPAEPFASPINIFMAHGGKGDEGFKTIYTKDSEGHAIIKEKGIETLFGNGVIAILFVCHSASIFPEAFAKKLVSLAHHTLSLGYQSVIAPAWSLNPDIAPVWLSEFLDLFYAGVQLSGCVYRANRKVAKAGYNEYHGFYTPTGWAAMHLYGNPDIRISNK